MRWSALLIALSLLGLVLLPGCADTEPTDGSEDDEDRRTYEECSSLTVPFEANGTEWEAARVECEANVTGSNSQSLSCPRPADAQLRAATNLTSGAVDVLVDDGENEQVAEHRLEDTGGQVRDLTVDEGAGGNWTVSAERLEGFEGKLQVELACPQEG